MELLLGVTLATLHDAMAAKGSRLEPHLVAWIGRELADALEYAHEVKDDAGKPLAIVHRDVNPKNVFVGFDGRIKLFDFGMAHALDRTARTDPNIVKGTLPYLAPEQVMQLPIDRRVDVFSLGTTLWELLTQRRLFRKDTDGETLRAVQFGAIPDVRTIVDDVDDRLAAIVKRSLERNRDHRYPTGAAIRADLDAFLMTRRTEPAPAPSRLATIVERLFPEERKKQSGWLKPRVSMPPPRASLTPPPPPTSSKPRG
jgi:serine/threonine-protein kinase